MTDELRKQFTFVREPHNYLKDMRITGARFNETPYEPKHLSSLDEWEEERERILYELLIGAGLLPMPEKCPLNARVFDKKVYDGFSVEKVIFQSLPGFYVTGTLYRPTAPYDKAPGIINPHGHAVHGRLEVDGENFNIPQRSVNFARAGFVSFSYDLVGFCDNIQIEHTYYGYDKDLWAENLFGLQLWNNMRCIDFMQSLPDVDPDRIGQTGSSCGGTQTLFTACVDDRVKATMSCNLISSTYTGSCICENCATLRYFDSNVDFAKLIAPKPLMVVGSSGDWTSDVPEKVYPMLKEVWDLYGAGDDIEYFFHEAPHNYNRVARERAVEYFTERLMGEKRHIDEVPFDFSDIDTWRIYPDGCTPDIPVYSDNEFYRMRLNDKKQRLFKVKDDANWSELSLRILSQATGCGRGEISEQRDPQPSHELYRHAADYAQVPVKFEADGFSGYKVVVKNSASGAAVPLLILKKGEMDLKNEKVALIISEKGKKSVFESIGEGGLVDSLLDKGLCVASPDLFLTGEYHKPYALAGRNLVNPDGKYKPSDSMMDCLYFSTYNYTDDAYRVQDVETVSRYLDSVSKEHVVFSFGGGDKFVAAAAPYLKASALSADFDSLTMLDEDDLIESFYLPLFLYAGGFEKCRKASACPVKSESELLSSL